MQPINEQYLIAGVASLALVAVAAYMYSRGISPTSARGQRLLGSVWPDLWYVRFRWWRRLDRRVPQVAFTAPVLDGEIVGTSDRPVEAAREQLRSHRGVYPDTLARLKYIDGPDGRHWEAGSYAYRPAGLLGNTQTHIRIFETAAGTTEFAAHWEDNPLVRPIRHYFGDRWDAERGVETARTVLYESGILLEQPADGPGADDPNPSAANGEQNDTTATTNTNENQNTGADK